MMLVITDHDETCKSVAVLVVCSTRQGTVNSLVCIYCNYDLMRSHLIDLHVLSFLKDRLCQLYVK